MKDIIIIGAGTAVLPPQYTDRERDFPVLFLKNMLRAARS